MSSFEAFESSEKQIQVDIVDIIFQSLPARK